MTYEVAIAALADPTRRAILERLRRRRMAVCDLARGLPVSRPAVSQHLRVLSDAGLVTLTPCGSRHLYALDPAGVAALRAWLDSMWDDVLVAYAAEADRHAGDPE